MGTEDNKKELSYKKSGVDVEAGYELVQKIKPFVEKTRRPEILTGLGSFSALSRIPKHIKNPILVTCTDGVGTKIEIAKELNQFETIGIDLVAMCVNDLLVCGAEPLVFLDYYVTDKLDVTTAVEVIKGIAKGCELAKCSLVGGETAEHPGSFPENSFDLAGFSLGIVDEDKIIGTDGPENNDVLIGIESSGFHSNGFSLIRKVIQEFDINLSTMLEGEELGNIFLKPTNIYVSEILSLKKTVKINAISHITGGGFNENIPRMLGNNQKALIKHNFADWPSGHYFEWLMKTTQMPKENLLNTFNCGVGLVISVNKADEINALELLNQTFFAKTIGHVEQKLENDLDIMIA
jgi:phosphoribosylformylglycinamidine cyclo-ligase